MKILLVSSSSGGHIYPCLAVGKYLAARGHEIVYLGIRGQMEETLIPDIVLLDVPNSFRKSLKAEEIARIRKEKKKIRQMISECDAIVAFGGFITALTTFLSIGSKKPVYLHEQNVVLGDAVRLSYPFCRRLFLSFDNALTKLKKGKYTFNPSAQSVLRRTAIDLRHPKVMFVFGSLSSSSCLKVVRDFLRKTSLPNEFLVVTGKNESLFQGIERSNVAFRARIEMREELKNCDLVFSRAGATTLAELLKSGVEIVAVPSPYVKRHHQEKNARFLEKRGYLSVIEEKDFTPDSIESAIIGLKRKNAFSLDIDPLKEIAETIENE